MAGLGFLLSIVLGSLLAQPIYRIGLSNLDFRATWIFSSAIFGSLFMIVICPIFAFTFGFYDVIRHYTLRAFLKLTSQVPLNYSKYLMDICETGLIRRRGSGFCFRNPLFQQYFAQLTLE
jgi:hypothetical protein